MSSLLQKNQQKGYWLTFAICAATAFFIFLPFLVVDKGLFQYCGDFNSQQIPFYTYMNDFVKHSAGEWSWETDLGSSAVNSYSFYLLGSPFFWITTLLPPSWVAYSFVPMFMLKFGVAGLGAFCWLRRYTKTRNFAIIGACLYAFSGFTVYNTFFNHFVDCIALFPFLLWSLDAFVYDKRRAVFALLVAVNLLNNYFFFAGQIVFLLLYFICKVLTKEYRIKWSAFGVLAFESVLGVAMGCLFLLPAALCLVDNPRTVDLSSGWGFLMYYRVQQYFAIFTSLFMPPDPPYLPAIYTEGVIKWTSLTAFLPVVSCAGVLAYLRARKGTAFTRILWTCFFMAFVPVLNSAFYALNSSYYARWFYMPILLMCAATVHSLEDSDIDLLGGLKTAGIITAAFLVFAIMPAKDGENWILGIANEKRQFWVGYLTALLGLLLFYVVLRFFKGKPRFATAMLAAVLGFSALYSVIHIALGKFPQWEGDARYKLECYTSAPKLEWPEDENFYRIDTYECYDNTGLWAKKSSLQFFNSVVTPSIMDFYPRLGVKRDVSSKPEHTLFALRGLLGVKYTLTPQDNAEDFQTTYSAKGWHLAFENPEYKVFENENYVGMGFAYDQYIRMSDLETVSETNRSEMLVRAIGLTDEQVERYGMYLQEATDRTTFGYESYVQDIGMRRSMAVDTFAADGTGFTATITLPSDNLVFFAVPYDSGFTATVNGQETTVERVSGGMCAVYAPAGTSTIVFTYRTPGLRTSMWITICGIGIWLAYCALMLANRRKAGRVAVETPLTALAPESQAIPGAGETMQELSAAHLVQELEPDSNDGTAGQEI